MVLRMNIDQKHALNKKVLKYIFSAKRQGNAPLIAAPDSMPFPYMSQGSHPDIVERVWNVIGPSLPTDCRCLVYGTPALVHSKSGIILAFCNGTQYCIRLADQHIEEALRAGAKTYTKWTDGGDMDTQRELGANWVFGHWLDCETEWCRIVYEELENS
jgi:hypothetical protein